MTDKLPPRFVILRANNGHLEPLGQAIEAIEDADLGQTKIEAFGKQFPNEKFELYRRVLRLSTETQAKVERAE